MGTTTNNHNHNKQCGSVNSKPLPEAVKYLGVTHNLTKLKKVYNANLDNWSHKCSNSFLSGAESGELNALTTATTTTARASYM